MVRVLIGILHHCGETKGRKKIIILGLIDRATTREYEGGIKLFEES